MTLARRWTMVACATLLLLWLLPGPVSSETYTCGDTMCLINSIARANANGPELDTIQLMPGSYLLNGPNNDPGPFQGANGLPVITTALTLVGTGGQGQTLLARTAEAPFFRLLEIAPTGTLRLEGVTLMLGTLEPGKLQAGGCVRNAGNLILRASTVRECAAWAGGGIDNVGTLVVQQSLIMANTAEFACGGLAAIGPTTIAQGSWLSENRAGLGGGVCSGAGPLVLRESVVTKNAATESEGGGLSIAGPAEISLAYISENRARLQGGGMHLSREASTVRQSTIRDNRSGLNGAGVYVESGTPLLDGVAILNNSAGGFFRGVTTTHGGGLHVNPVGQVRLRESWLLGNQAFYGPECNRNVTLESWNVIGDATRLVPPGETPCHP
jgi:hypothetical protein